MSSAQRDFAAYFAAWAPKYDDTVNAPEGLLAEVFAGYLDILDEVAARVKNGARLVIDVGVGTGNLSLACLRRGLPILGVEPSPEMRELARSKLPISVQLRAGDFLHLPVANGAADAVVSTWAFHHVPDDLKPAAVREVTRVLDTGGQAIMADTAFESEWIRQAVLRRLLDEGRQDWVDELQAEYYPTLDTIETAFREVGYRTTFLRLNQWVWLWEAVRA